LGTVNIPFGETIEIGQRPRISTDPIRIMSRIRQEIGTVNPYLKFWTPYKTENLNSLLYLLVHSLKFDNVPVTPKTITFAMILGTEKLKKIIDFSIREYGTANIPDPPFDLLSELNLSKPEHKDNIIFIDHNSQFVCISNWDCSFSPDPGQVESDVVSQINNYLMDKGDDFGLGPYSSISDIEDCLPNQCVSIDITMPKLNSDPTGITISEEDRKAIEYLIYQISAPEYQAPVELEMRNDLAYNIYGLQDDAPDVLSDEEGLLDMFG
jgi:hypothetical protein